MKIMQSSRGRTVAVSAVGLAGIAAAGLIVQQYSTRPVVQVPAPPRALCSLIRTLRSSPRWPMRT